MLPQYLVKKLNALNINSLDELQQFDPIQVFQWLKYQHKSIANQVLFDLYSLHKSQNISKLSISTQTLLINQFKTSSPSYPPLPKETATHYLNHAVIAAKVALKHNEIPIGAIIVSDNIEHAHNVEDFSIIGRGYNMTLINKDICAHAEIIAIQEASKHLNTHRLNNCDLYVTIEPCLMCMGAILHSRIRRVIFGATEPKTGAIISQYKVLENSNFNHQTESIGPINNNLYKTILQEFMQKKRLK